MYSKAKISGHPIHPALVAFPIAFYVGALVSLIAFAATRDAFWFRVACYASTAGVVMGAVAAIPGLIDLLSIPSGTKARATAYTHALLNVVTLLLFVIVAMITWRQWSAWPSVSLDARLPLILAVVGSGTLIAAGAFGWKLVQTHHVGVTDPMPLEETHTTTLTGVGGTMREPHVRTR
jgi:uncharacterized membrane protein